MYAKSSILILIIGIFSISANPSSIELNPVQRMGIEEVSDKFDKQLAKSLDDADESDDELDIDEITSNTSGVNTKTNPKFPKKTNPTYRLTPPANNNSYTIPSLDDIDPEKQKQMTKDGLKQIETNEAKNNKASLKNIARLLLTNPIPEVRAEAARALGRIGKGAKALHRAIDTDGYEVRQHCYKSLEKIGSRTSLKYFLKGLKSSDKDIKIASFKGLGKTRSSTGRDMILKQGLNSKDPNVVAAALDGLGNFSRKDDLEILKKYLKSEAIEHQSGAIRGLGNSKNPEALELLSSAITENPGLEPEVIFAISKKKSLNATLLLMKMLQTNKNENFQAIIQREINLRKAFGKYAVIKTNTAILRKLPKASAEKVIVLNINEVGKVKKITDKRFKVKLNGAVVEDRYYLVQAISDKEGSKKGIIEGWVFGAKINTMNILNPAKKGMSEDELLDEDSEDEKTVVSEVNPADAKKPTKTIKKEPVKDEYEIEDEDEE
jgi:hypothetical protein